MTEVDFFDLFGQDALGTRIANTMERHAIDTVEGLARWSDLELLRMSNLGIAALDRIHSSLEHCDRWESANKTRLHRQARAQGLQGRTQRVWESQVERNGGRT